MSGWVGVDLDGTLAYYGGWKGPDHIGEPIPAMVERVKQWIAEDREVRIMTARVGCTDDFVENSQMTDDQKFAAEQREIIGAWCERHIGKRLPVTCKKDYGMIELWDDRCIHVEANTGRIIG